MPPFDLQPRLTQIAMAVMVDGTIADMVCPRVDVGGEKFAYTKLMTDEILSIPDTLIGRSGQANQVDFGAADTIAQILDYGLESPVPIRDIMTAQSQPTNFDPMERATEGLMQLVDLSREKRVADLYTTLGTYASTLRETLAGTAQWSNATSDPVNAILEAKDKMLVRPNMLVMGQAVWTQFRQHPKVVEAIYKAGGGAAGTPGVAAMDAVRDLLELEELHVGMSWYNTAKPGQTASFSRLWGKHAALLRINRQIVSAESVLPTFAFTASWMDRRVGTYEDPKRGAEGSTIVKIIEHLRELVSWQGVGYFFQNAVA